MQRSTFVRAALAAASTCATTLTPRLTWAQAGSTRAASLRIIVPFPPGGAADTYAHLIGQRLAAMNTLALTVDTSPRASGVLGTYAASRAPADGSTLLITTLGHAVR